MAPALRVLTLCVVMSWLFPPVASADGFFPGPSEIFPVFLPPPVPAPYLTVGSDGSGWGMHGTHLPLQLCPDLLSDLGSPLPCGGGNSSPDSHLAFMSI